jgi:hypothetical protein
MMLTIAAKPLKPSMIFKALASAATARTVITHATSGKANAMSIQGTLRRVTAAPKK